MKISIVSFTAKGLIVNQKITVGLKSMGYSVYAYADQRHISIVPDAAAMINEIDSDIKYLIKAAFDNSDALVFVGATGIAVRLIAPYINSKFTDPAIITIDDNAGFCISLLSGHVGGANKLASIVAKIAEAVLVISTATDINKKFAVDMWAHDSSLIMSSNILAKNISASLLDDKNIGFYSDYSIVGDMPKGFVKGEKTDYLVWITNKIHPEQTSIINEFTDNYNHILRLIPLNICLGVGCKRGMSYQDLNISLCKFLEEINIDIASVYEISSIDVKANEQGINQLAQKLNISFTTYSSVELEKLEGTFTDSEFVKKTVGTGNVCERACSMNCNHLIAHKRSYNGITWAAAYKDVSYSFN